MRKLSIIQKGDDYILNKRNIKESIELGIGILSVMFTVIFIIAFIVNII